MPAGTEGPGRPDPDLSGGQGRLDSNDMKEDGMLLLQATPRKKRIRKITRSRAKKTGQRKRASGLKPLTPGRRACTRAKRRGALKGFANRHWREPPAKSVDEIIEDRSAPYRKDKVQMARMQVEEELTRRAMEEVKRARTKEQGKAKEKTHKDKKKAEEISPPRWQEKDATSRAQFKRTNTGRSWRGSFRRPGQS